MKHKFLTSVLIISIVLQSTYAYAKDFNPIEAFKDYVEYDDSQVNESYKHYYIVSKSNDDNSKALFSEDKQLTDFIYDSIDVDNCGIVVSQKKDNIEYFGLIDDENYTELLPVKYKLIENYEITGYIAENTDNSKEYYIVKTPVNEAPNNVDYEETDKLYILNSYDDLKNVLNKNETESALTPIEGIDNCYITSDSSGFYVNIVNENGEKLVETDFRSVEYQAGKYDTIVVHYAEGMTDSSLGLLSKDCKTIVPQNFYSSINFITVNNTVYVEAVSYIDNSYDYYDLNGNKGDKPDENITLSDTSYSQWAEESINKSIELNLIPENLQSSYTAKITRGEFCQLAMQTYTVKTGNTIDENVKSPFSDIDDIYITNAYNLKIVSGVGNNKFAPNNNITRQEAAVMLNNLADAMAIEKDNIKSDKFVDESYFADWAKNAIYTVCGIKSGDTYVMAGTGNGKFSPWMNYTREQAIATMYRLYNCEVINLFYDGQYEQSRDEAEKIYGDWLFYETIDVNENHSIIRLSIDGSKREVLASNKYGEYIVAIENEYIYYCERDIDAYITYYKMKLDGSDREVLASNKNGQYIGAIENEYIYCVETDINGYGTYYKMKSDGSDKKIIEQDEFDNICNNCFNHKKLCDNKYLYYTTGVMEIRSDYDYLTRSDLDGNNEIRLYDKPIFNPPILYKNYVYTIISHEVFIEYPEKSEWVYDIVGFDSEGNMHNITNVKPESNPMIVKIIKIDDDKIYFKKATEFLIDMPQNSDLIYSINIDGSNEKLIY